VKGRGREELTMNHDQLLALIREKGPLAVAAMVAQPWVPTLADGVNLANWSVTHGGGAILFIHGTQGVIDSHPRICVVNAPESERAFWEDLVRDAGADAPITLLLHQQYPDPFA
jgi:hypothetical protein